MSTVQPQRIEPPASATSGSISAQLVSVVADSSLDVDVFPDWMTMPGVTFEFTPPFTEGVYIDGTTKWNIYPKMVTGTTSGEGKLLNASTLAEGISLMATDNDKISPSGGTWSCRAKDQNGSFMGDEFHFPVLGGTTKTLAELWLAHSPKAAALTPSEFEALSARITAVEAGGGGGTGVVVGPPGPAGPAGPEGPTGPAGAGTQDTDYAALLA